MKRSATTVKLHGPVHRFENLSSALAAELMSIADMPATPPAPDSILESGVLAFRRDSSGEPLVLLISRRRSGKWGIPKGKVSPRLTLAQTAAKEAFEEAGVLGSVSPQAVGTFRAEKRNGGAPSRRIIEVWVYLMEVTETVRNWPEKGKRKTRWVSCDKAARHLREPALARICHRLARD